MCPLTPRFLHLHDVFTRKIMTSQIPLLLLHTVPFLVIRTQNRPVLLLREAVSSQDPHLS